LIFLDGRLYEGPTVAFDLSDRGLLLGDGLFETMPAFGGTVFRRQDHIDRMLAGAATLNLPVAEARLNEAIDSLLPHAPQPAATLWLTLTRGPGPRGVRPPADPKPTVIATCAPWNPSLAFGTARLALAASRRNEHSPLSRLKTMNYLDAVLAQDDAGRRGFDDALFLDTMGNVACSTAANIFAVKGKVLQTPPADAVLPGIVRALVLKLAPGLGYEGREAALTVADLRSADEVFLTNSVRLVTSVSALEDFAFVGRNGAADVVRGAIIGAIRKECGHDIERPD
jgi:branched-chain amino acid aminotransferase